MEKTQVDSEAGLVEQEEVGDEGEEEEEEEEDVHNSAPSADIIGKLVWCPDEDYAWVTAVVKRFQVVEQKRLSDALEIEYEVELTKNKQRKRFLRSEVQNHDASHSLDLDNICMMNDMQEAPLLDLLRRRFHKRNIYTYAGGILISLNPYESISGLYSNPRQYFSLQRHASPEIIALTGARGPAADQVPHVYQISNNALRTMTREANRSEYQDQSVIISGESGAGKTENSKHVINFFIDANNFFSSETKDREESSFADQLKQILVQSSVVLEAFGNAKTVRNDNSSRFGKYIKLLYVPQEKPGSEEVYPKLISAKTETFLLEKSRLTNVGRGERSYHIFHQLMLGLENPAVRDELGLSAEATSFRLLSEGECKVNQADREEYQLTLHALASLQCSSDEIQQIIKLLGAIIQLRNLDVSSIDNDSSGSVLIESSTFSFDRIAKLLGVDPEVLKVGMTVQTVKVRGRSSITTKRLSADDVTNNANALLKWLYSKLFDWLVRKINYCHSSVYARRHETSFIGILDIFGFEILRTNSFEQLCINFTNERLQQQFNQHVFVTEQEMYKEEGLEWSSISFRDNQPVIDVISSTKKPMGLLLLLEELGMLNRKPDDMALLSSFNQTHHVQVPPQPHQSHPPHPHSHQHGHTAVNAGSVAIYSKARFGNTAFTLKHFAGEVTYSIEGFLIKNNDSLQDDLTNVLYSTTNEFLRHVIQIGTPTASALGFIPEVEAGLPATTASTANETSASGGKKMASAASVSQQFRSQLDTLMSTLYSTVPHYIKCVKSNNVKQAGEFEAPLVIQQLRYSGVLEVVRIRREGFPMRMTFEDFYLKYQVLLKGTGTLEVADGDYRQGCKDILRAAAVGDMVQVGHSMVFLRDRGIIAMQDAITTFYARRAECIQSKYKMVLARRRYHRMRQLITQVKSFLQMVPRRQHYLKVRRSTVKIQAFYISRKLRSRFIQALRLKFGSIVIQSQVRRMLQHWRYQKLRASVRRVQSWYRAQWHRRGYRRVVSATIKVQSILRMMACVSVYRLQYASIVALQSFSRKVIARRRYELSLASLVSLQTSFRKFRAMLQYRRARKGILLIQKVARGHFARQTYHGYVGAVMCLQSWARMILARQRYVTFIISTIAMQAIVRCHLARRHVQRVMKQIVKLQSWRRKVLAKRSFHHVRRHSLRLQSFGRMIIARNAYSLQLISIISIQTLIRKVKHRKHYLQARARTIQLQALFRMLPHKWLYKGSLRAAIMVAKYIRRWRDCTAYQKIRRSTIRTQKAVKAFLRNQELRRRLQKLHEPIRAPGQPTVQQLLKKNPEDRWIRYSYNERHFRTALQSQLLLWRASSSGSTASSATASATSATAERMPVMEIVSRIKGLAIRATDCFEVDRLGRCAAHYLAMAPSMALLKRVVEAIDSYQYVTTGPTMEALEEDDDDNAATAAGQAKESARGRVMQMIAESVNRSKLRQGWLKKKRGGLMWQKRWVVLTEDYIVYYNSNTTANAPRFAIPLEGCTVQRVTGTREPIFEVWAPNMGEKKTFFGSASKKSISFLAESEQEMQEWLTPLRAVAGVDKLRASPITYIKPELRQLWLNMTDRGGETALHALIRSSVHATNAASVEEALRLLGWMAEHGANINAQNAAGDTPLHVAMSLKVDRRIVRLLLLKGGDPKAIKNKENRSALQMLSAGALNVYKDEVAMVAAGPALKPTVPLAGKIKGYSYLTLFFNQQDFSSDKASLSEQPSLTISAMNSKRQLVEPAKELRGPALIQLQGAGKSVHWAMSWHMQTPLENLDAGSFVLIEYRARASANSEKTAAAEVQATSVAQLPLDRENMDSMEVTLQCAVSSEGGRANPIMAQQEKGTLCAVVSISRKPRDITVLDLFS